MEIIPLFLLMETVSVSVSVSVSLPSVVVFFTLVFLSSAFPFFPSRVRADPRAEFIGRICSSEYARNVSGYADTYSEIVPQLRDELPATKFALKQSGEPPDGIYLVAQCMDDLSPRDCGKCISRATSLFPGCFPSNGGRVYLDGCFLRADNYSFFDDASTPQDFMRCSDGINSDQDFDDLAKNVMDELVRRTADSGGFAVYDESADGFTVYGMASCWKTLSSARCTSCLDSAAISAFACLPSTEGRVLNTGCFLHYSDSKFVNEHNFQEPDAALFFVSHILSIISMFIFAMIVGFFVGKAAYKKWNRENETIEVEVDSLVLRRTLQFKHTTLEKATGYFREDTKLGQGGFGEVFKGTLGDGREIAIKRLFITGQSESQEVYNEIDIIGSANHKNLVRFLGCCFTNQDCFLVYEFLVNRSLDRVLFDSEKKKELPWKVRLGIIMGTAEGLEYLHQDSEIRIIHRDIKASNILLDHKYRPKIADFGLARFCSSDRALINTAIQGTLGYMAPEYLAHGHLTEKVDVYGYGVLILEIVSGVQNNKFQPDDPLNTLVTATWKHFQSNTMSEIVDKGMEVEDMEEVTRVIQVGLLCTQESPTLRPPMNETIKMLKHKDVSLPVPSKPPFTEENLTMLPVSDHFGTKLR